MNLRQNIVVVLLLPLLLVLGAASIWYGGSEAMGDVSAANEFILYQIRFPKTITAILAGASLALSGMILQIVFRNPLAGHYVLGVSSGASLFVAIGMLTGTALQAALPSVFNKLFIVSIAVFGSLLTTALILAVAKKINSNVILLLIGLMLAQLFGAAQMGLEYFSDPYNLKLFVIWGMGSLSTCTLEDLKLFAPLVVLLVLALFFKLKALTAFLYGEEYARSMGIDYKRERFWLILIASVLTGLSTAFCGPIAFVGIAVPILGRLMVQQASLWQHFLLSIFLGAGVLLLADVVSNNLVMGFTLPINVITTLFGAPVVIYLMFKTKQW